MLSSLFKKKTREEHVEKRTQSVLAELLGDTEFEFTDLETVQVLNNVRRKLVEHLIEKRAEFMEHSSNYSQTASELTNVIKFIE